MSNQLNPTTTRNQTVGVDARCRDKCKKKSSESEVYTSRNFYGKCTQQMKACTYEKKKNE